MADPTEPRKTAAKRVQIVSGTIPPNALRRNGATPARPGQPAADEAYGGGPGGPGDGPRAGDAGARGRAGGGGGGAGGGGIDARAHVKRFGPDFPDADEVVEPNPDARQEWAQKRISDKDSATDLANRLAIEWGVNGARVIVADLGVAFLTEFLEFMNEARQLGELGKMRNPAGMFVKKAYRTYDRRREERAADSGHPGAGDGPWDRFAE